MWNPGRRLMIASVAVCLLAGITPGWGQDALPTTSLKLDTRSQKVPAGTMLTVRFNSELDSRISTEGEPFTAFIQQDFKAPGLDGDSRVILPRGTLVRGRVDAVKKPGLFSRGGTILLTFDHVVLPTGDLMPLDLDLSAKNDAVRRVRRPGTREAEFALYDDPGVGYKIHKSFESGVNTLGRFKDAGSQAGEDLAGGAGKIVTVPAAVVGGVFAGTAVTAGKSVMALVGKGESATIEPGDTVNIDFGGAFNLPAE